MEFFHASHTRQLATSLSNWLPYLGPRLRLLDLSSSDLLTFDAGTWNTKLPALVHLRLSHLPTLDLSALTSLLCGGSNPLLERLLTLEIANVSASDSRLSLDKLIAYTNATRLNLTHLDISHNAYAFDLNTLFFGQPKFANLRHLLARNNKFTGCNSKVESVFLTQLERLDLSGNGLKGDACLTSILGVGGSLCRLDLSRNNFSFDVNVSLTLFADKPKLSFLDLSHNELVTFITYYGLNRTDPVEILDLSFNKLNKFQILSLSRVRACKLLDEEEFDGNDGDDEEIELGAGADGFKLDDDERFVYVDKLDLSWNQLEVVHVQHMLQSVRNVINLDLSFNPLRQVVGMSNAAPITSQILVDKNGEEVLPNDDDNGENDSDEYNDARDKTKG